MEHQTLTINHRLESWVYADDGARTGATGFNGGDVGRIGYQSDTGQYWRLTATAPTWALIAPMIAPVYATLQTAILSPTAVAGTTNKMFGLGSTAFLTPHVTGKVRVAITAGAYYCTGGAYISQTQIAYGSGTAPANGAAASGTVIGSVVQTPTGPGTTVASLEALITGLTPGTQYWFDLAVVSNNAAASANAASVTVAAAELP